MRGPCVEAGGGRGRGDADGAAPWAERGVALFACGGFGAAVTIDVAHGIGGVSPDVAAVALGASSSVGGGSGARVIVIVAPTAAVTSASAAVSATTHPRPRAGAV